MKVEQKFIVTIKDSPFELSKEEVESLYYELQKELGLMPKINIPYSVPFGPKQDPPLWIKDQEWHKPVHPTIKPNPIPDWTVICSQSSSDTIP